MSSLDLSSAFNNQLEFSARYYYQLKSSSGLELIVLRDEAPPKITGGRGGWEVVARRRRKGLTTWVGRDPLSMDVPVLFNGWFDPPYSVDQDKSVLMQMADGDNFVIPPTVTIEGNLPVKGGTWVIQDLTWGDNTIWIVGDDGTDILVRQDCVIKLLQYVEEDVVRITAINPVPSSYHIRPGDTPHSVAKRFTSVGQNWKELRRINPPGAVRDSEHFGPGVTVIILPARWAGMKGQIDKGPGARRTGGV